MDEEFANELTGKEWSEAQKEKYKAVQKGLGLVDRSANFLGNLFGPAAETVGSILDDKVKYWRIRNIDKTAEKYRMLQIERGIESQDIKQLPFGDAYRVTSAISEEDNEDVQELWAQLLLTAGVSEAPEIERPFIDIMKGLSKNEVKLLSVRFDYMYLPMFSKTEFESLEIENFKESYELKFESMTDREISLATEGLIRKRLFAPIFTFPDMFGEMHETDTIVDHIEKLSKRELAEGISNMFDAISISAGFGQHMNDPELKKWHLNDLHNYDLTELGFQLMGATRSSGK